jgi:hypothetical protein
VFVALVLVWQKAKILRPVRRMNVSVVFMAVILIQISAAIMKL